MNDLIKPETIQNDLPNENMHRRIRSFVLRQGRLTKGQAYALETFWPQFGIEYAENVLDLNQEITDLKN